MVLSRRHTGFTLIEILVVIVMLSVLSGGVMLSVHRSRDEAAVKDAARRISDMISYCHSMAVFEARAFRLYFEPEKGRCGVFYEADPLNQPGSFAPYRHSGFALRRIPEGVYFKDVRLLKQDYLESSWDSGSSATEEWAGTYIEFRPDGTSEDTLIVLASVAASEEREEIYTLVLSGLTSQLRIYDRKVELEDNEYE